MRKRSSWDGLAGGEVVPRWMCRVFFLMTGIAGAAMYLILKYGRTY